MNRNIAYGLLVLSACLFGASGVWGKILFHAHLTPIQVTAFRTIVAGLCITIFAGLNGAEEFRVTRKQFLFLAGFSIMFTVMQLFFYLAVALTGVAIALTLQYTAPMFVVLWEKIRHGRAIGRRRLLSMAAAVIGCALIAQVANTAFFPANLPGVVAGFASGLVFAVYNIYGRLPCKAILMKSAAQDARIYPACCGAMTLLAMMGVRSLSPHNMIGLEGLVVNQASKRRSLPTSHQSSPRIQLANRDSRSRAVITPPDIPPCGQAGPRRSLRSCSPGRQSRD